MATEPDVVIDPKQLIGCWCSIVGTSRDDLNGQTLLCTSYDPQKARYKLKSPPPSTLLNLKPDNLEKATKLNEVKAQATELYNLMMNPPKSLYDGNGNPVGQSEQIAYQSHQIMKQFQQLTVARVPTFCQPYLRQITGLLFFLLAVHFYYRGLLLTLVLIMATYYPLMIALPDLLQPALTPIAVLKNIPTRVEENVRQATGRSFDKKYVAPVLVVILLIVGKVLLTPKGYAAAVPPPVFPTSTSTADEMGGDHYTLTSIQLDEFYNLGYNAADNEIAWGINGLAEMKAKYSKKSSSRQGQAPSSANIPRGISDDDEFDDIPSSSNTRYAQPPIPTSKGGLSNLLNISTIFTLGLLGKFVYDTGGGSAWSVQNFVRNAQEVARKEPYKLMMPAFGVFRLFSAIRG